MSAAGYSRGAVWFHWTIALLIMLAAALALFRETFAPVAGEMISAHKAVGLAILALSLARLCWRLTHRPPPSLPRLRPWEARIAGSAHALLYFFMLAVPLAGWIFSSSAPLGSPVDYAGFNSVPRLPLERDRATSWFWHEAHELMGFAMIGLFLLHIAGALKHQLLDRDNMLARMVPWLRRGPAASAEPPHSQSLSA